jgi:TonB family protein
VGSGMAGQVAVDATNFEFAYYLQQVRSLIARNWAPSAGVPTGTRVEVYFRVSRDGSLTAPRIEVSSGNAYFDQSAARAVIVTGHLPPLPLGYAGGDLGIHFGFEYTGS